MEKTQKKKPGCLLISIILLVVTAVTIWVVVTYVFPKRFNPVELSQPEQQVLNRKLTLFEGFGSSSHQQSSTENLQSTNTLQPEKYDETGASRRIEFSEKELNSLLASNTNMAERVAIDLSPNLASGKWLIHLDPDFPVMGGKTIKLAAGLELAFRNSRPVVVLKGVSIMGVPIPNSWLGDLKNVDLVREFGGDDGFWKSFSEGVEYIEVSEGRLVIQLKE